VLRGEGGKPSKSLSRKGFGSDEIGSQLVVIGCPRKKVRDGRINKYHTTNPSRDPETLHFSRQNRPVISLQDQIPDEIPNVTLGKGNDFNGDVLLFCMGSGNICRMPIPWNFHGRSGIMKIVVLVDIRFEGVVK